MFKIKRSIVLLLILAIGVTSVGGFVFADQLFVEKDKHVIVDFTANIPDGPFTIKKGDTKVIPIEVMTPRNKDVDLQVYVNEPEDISQPGPQTEEKFSPGIAVNVEKKSVKVAHEIGTTADIGTDYKVRDTLPLSISVSKDATVGDHIISVTLFEDKNNDRKFITFYLHVNVEN
jgi:hypothetical protein